MKALSFDDAAERYGALYLRDALARFVVQHRDPTLTAAEVEQQSLNVSLHFRKVQAFNKLKFILDDAQDLGVMEDVRDAAHARPERQDKQGRTVPGRFDTVLVNNGTGGRSGVQGKSRYAYISSLHVSHTWYVFQVTRWPSSALFSSFQTLRTKHSSPVSLRPAIWHTSSASPLWQAQIPCTAYTRSHDGAMDPVHDSQVL